MTTETHFDRDAEGYLVDPENWSEPLAHRLAEDEGLELNRDYWPVLHFIRQYWAEHRVIPDVRHVVSFLAKELGFDKKQAKKHLFELFPYGYVKQACKVAGMQRPRGWSTG